MFHWNDAPLPIVSVYSNIFLGINLLISIYCALKLNQQGGLPTYFKWVNYLLLLFAVYGIYSIALGPEHIIKFTGDHVKNGTFLVAVLRSFLPVYAFYYFAKCGQITLSKMKVIAIILLIVSVYIYLQNLYLHLLISNKEEFTNNTGYLLLSCLPLVFLFDKNTIIQYAYIGVVSLFVLSALKRGAIIVDILLIVYFFMCRFKNTSRRNKFLFYIATIVFCIIGFRYISNFIENSALFQQRFDDTLSGNTSGRSSIIGNLKNYYFVEANILQMLFGSGADATLDVGVNYAHNDWWEILIDLGLLGVVVYICYWWGFYKQWKSTVQNTMVFEILGAFMILFFVRCFFSMSYSILPLSFGLGIGFALANKDNLELNNE